MFSKLYKKNSVCWWYFFFPPKVGIYPDGATNNYLDENGKMRIQRKSYTLRNFAATLWGTWLCDYKRFWSMRLPDRLIFQAGAIATDAGTADDTDGTTASFAHTCTGSDLMLMGGVYGVSGGADDISSITYNSVGATKSNSILVGAAAAVDLWYLVNPATGSNSFVWNADTSLRRFASAVSYTGVAQNAPEASEENNGTSITSLQTAITTVADNAWVVGQVGNDTGATSDVSAGTVKRLVNDDNRFFVDKNEAQTPPGSKTIDTTQASSGGIAHAIVSLAPVGEAVTAGRLASNINLLGVG